MTAKRFTTNGQEIIQNKQVWCVANSEHCADVIATAMNELCKEKEQLLSDKEHLMGYLIRFCRFDDDDLDYVMSRESNREYGKQYYSMKEEDW